MTTARNPMTTFELREPTTFGPHYTKNKDRYLLRLPGEDKARARTRATTFVKKIDDSSNLAPWMAAMGIVGVLTDTATRAAWAALMADSGGDPWYHSEATKARAKQLVEIAKDRGGANARRDTGTALHGVLESVVTGRAKPEGVLEEFRPFVVNALALLDAEGLDPVPELCEQSVYVGRYDVVGRFDLILRRRSDGRLIQGDWKTGGQTWKPKNHWKTKVQEGWRDGYADSDLGHCAQMALYAMADHIIVWPACKESECTLHPYPEVDPAQAVVVHIPSTEGGVVSLRYLDLDVGRRALELAAGIRELDRAKPLVARIGAAEPPWPSVAGSEISESSESNEVPSAPATPERKAWIVARVTRIVQATDTSMPGELAAVWPLPGVRASLVTTDEQIDALAAACLHVEAQHLWVYDQPDPAHQPALDFDAPGEPVPTESAAVAYDAGAEGRDVAAEDTAALVRLLQALDADRLAVIGAVACEASAAGVGLSLRFRFDDDRERPLRDGEPSTYRRWMIARALWCCAVAGIGHDDLREVLYLATGRLDARQLPIPVGAVVGTLTASEADRVAIVAQRIADGTAVVTYAADGIPAVDDATRAALAAA